MILNMIVRNTGISAVTAIRTRSACVYRCYCQLGFLLSHCLKYCTLTLGLISFPCQSAKVLIENNSWNALLSTHLQNLLAFYCQNHSHRCIHVEPTISPQISLITSVLYYVNEYRNLLLFFFYSCSIGLFLQYTPTHKNYLFFAHVFSIFLSLSLFVICFDPQFDRLFFNFGPAISFQFFEYFAKWQVYYFWLQ